MMSNVLLHIWLNSDLYKGKFYSKICFPSSKVCWYGALRIEKMLFMHQNLLNYAFMVKLYVSMMLSQCQQQYVSFTF